MSVYCCICWIFFFALLLLCKDGLTHSLLMNLSRCQLYTATNFDNFRHSLSKEVKVFVTMWGHSCSLKPVSFCNITEKLLCVKRILFRYEAHIPKVEITNCHNTHVVPSPPPPPPNTLIVSLQGNSSTGFRRTCSVVLSTVNWLGHLFSQRRTTDVHFVQDKLPFRV